MLTRKISSSQFNANTSIFFHLKLISMIKIIHHISLLRCFAPTSIALPLCRILVDGNNDNNFVLKFQWMNNSAHVVYTHNRLFTICDRVPSLNKSYICITSISAQ